MQQVEAGRMALGDVELLLAHRSGLPATAPAGDVATVRPTGPPGEYRYSDVGMILLGRLLQEATGTPLDVLLERHITGPLGLADTGFRPAFSERIVATEAKPGRGLVRGAVHDETAYALGGVAGHAGIFSTAHDLAVFGHSLLGATTRGFAVDQPSFMGRLASPHTFGHTGFTGTSIVVDPRRKAVVVLLTNRVHPDRSWGGVNEARVAVADIVAEESLDTVP